MKDFSGFKRESIGSTVRMAEGIAHTIEQSEILALKYVEEKGAFGTKFLKRHTKEQK